MRRFRCAPFIYEGAGLRVIVDRHSLPGLGDLGIVGLRVRQEAGGRFGLHDEVGTDREVRHLVDAGRDLFHGPELLAFLFVEFFQLFRIVIDRELSPGQFVFRVVLVDLREGQFADRHRLRVQLRERGERLIRSGAVRDKVLLAGAVRRVGPVSPDDHTGLGHAPRARQGDRLFQRLGGGQRQGVPRLRQCDARGRQVPFGEDAVRVGQRRFILFGRTVIFQRIGALFRTVLLQEGGREQFRFHLLLDVGHGGQDVGPDGVPAHDEPVDRYIARGHRKAVEIRVPLPDDDFPEEQLGRPVLREGRSARTVLGDPAGKARLSLVAVVQDRRHDLALPVAVQSPVPGQVLKKVFRGCLFGQGVSGMEGRRGLDAVHRVAGVVVIEDLDREPGLFMDGPPVHEFQFGVAPVRVRSLAVRVPRDVRDLHGHRARSQGREAHDRGGREQDQRRQRGDEFSGECVLFHKGSFFPAGLPAPQRSRTR